MARFDVVDEENRRFSVVCFRGLEKMLEVMEEKYGQEMTGKLFRNRLYRQDGMFMDIIYYPSINEFRGKTSLQFILQDCK